MQVKSHPVMQQVNDVLLGQQKFNIEPARAVRPYDARHQKTEKGNG